MSKSLTLSTRISSTISDQYWVEKGLVLEEEMPREVICLGGSCDGVGIVMPEGGHLPGGEL